MLDASASVGPENFARMQSFLRSCTLQFDVNPDVMQMGLVVYGGQVQTAFGLDTHTTRATVLRALSQAPYLGGAGSAGTALLHIYDKVMTVQMGARPGVPKVVIVVTGGQGVEDAAVPAEKLRDNGVSVLVVGVGPVLREALRRLAGPRDSLIHVAAYEDLSHHQDTLIEWICRGEWGSAPSGLPPRWGPQPEPLPHYKDGSSSQLPGAFHLPGCVLHPTLTKPCRRHTSLFKAQRIEYKHPVPNLKMQKFPGQGSNLSHSSDNADSFNHLATRELPFHL